MYYAKKAQESVYKEKMMSPELRVYLHTKDFSKNSGELLTHPEEFCESVNKKIWELKLTILVGVARAAIAACAFCLSAGGYYFALSSLAGRVGSVTFGLLGMILVIKVIDSYCLYVEQYRAIKEEIDKYPEHFLFKEKVRAEVESFEEGILKIKEFFPFGFKLYPIEIFKEKTEEWQIEWEGGKGKIFTNGKAEMVSSPTEIDGDFLPWLDLLVAIVDANQIPDSIKRELVREIFPLIAPSHCLSSLPSNQLQSERLAEGEVAFRRSSEGAKAQAIIAHTHDSKTYYREADDLKSFLVRQYQIELKNRRPISSDDNGEEDPIDSAEGFLFVR
ncbi:MAG: hypothetical protein IT584_02430 [Chlamydiae bacterium]|nr:hypothetical protein [Chlamydiota bacterium]